MAPAKNAQRQAMNSMAGMLGMPPIMQNPMLTIFAEMQGSFLESMATAQKDWMAFVHRRIKEDVAASRQLMRCQSVSEMHQIYAEYFETAFEQYQKQSERWCSAARAWRSILPRPPRPLLGRRRGPGTKRRRA